MSACIVGCTCCVFLKSPNLFVVFSNACFLTFLHFYDTSEKDIVYALACRGDDFYFSSFVNLLVQTYLHKSTSPQAAFFEIETLPLVTLFGSGFEWSIRDVKQHYFDSYYFDIIG